MPCAHVTFAVYTLKNTAHFVKKQKTRPICLLTLVCGFNYSPGCHSAGVNREVWIHYTKKRTTSTFVETMMLVSQLCKRGTTVFKKRWLKACYEKDDATNVICILVTYLR